MSLLSAEQETFNQMSFTQLDILIGQRRLNYRKWCPHLITPTLVMRRGRGLGTTGLWKEFHHIAYPQDLDCDVKCVLSISVFRSIFIVMRPENFPDIEDAISEAHSLRGALFILKNHVPEFMGNNVTYEYFVRANGFMRGDVITATTLPSSVTSLYVASGGQNADPVIERIAKVKDKYTVSLEGITKGRRPKYKTKFYKAMSEIGIQTMTVYAFLPPKSRGYGGFTVLEETPNASLAYPAERYARIALYFHILMMQNGQIMRYLDINEKEQNALKRMADGKTAQDVAQEESVTSRTVEMRLASARKKLKSRTTTEAVFKSVCYGIL